MAENDVEDVERWDKLKKLFRLKKSGYGSEEETGFDRIKSLFRMRYGEPLPEEVKDFPTVVLSATCMGFVFGGMIGARHAGDKFIAFNHHAKFSSTMQAQRQLHSAATLGLVRHGCKWGWKIGLFAGIFSGATILLTAYRDKEDSLNYIGAGGITGGIHRLKWGVMPTIGGSVLGLLISIPIGLFIEGLSRIVIGTEERVKIRNKLYQARQEREKHWKQNLDATSVLIADIDVESQGKEDGLKTYYDVLSKSTASNQDVDSSSKPGT